jgi:hypothetical protein
MGRRLPARSPDSDGFLAGEIAGHQVSANLDEAISPLDVVEDLGKQRRQPL